MDKNIIEMFEDFGSCELPKNLEDIEKVKCLLINGQRVYWYYKDELVFCKEEEIDIKEMDYWSGIVVARPFIEKAHPTSDMEIEDCMICVDWTPCEKCYPETWWISLGRLIDDEELVEVYTKEN